MRKAVACATRLAGSDKILATRWFFGLSHMGVVRQIWMQQLAEACLIDRFLGLYPRLDHHLWSGPAQMPRYLSVFPQTLSA
jgi:hypothetical protein